MIKRLCHGDKNFIVIERIESLNQQHVRPRRNSCVKSNCMIPSFGSRCICNFRFFLVRPYTYEFLSVICTFFEIIGMAKMALKEITQIVKHFELYLNKPIVQKNLHTINSVQKSPTNQVKNKQLFLDPSQQYDRIGRFTPKLIKKRYFFKLVVSDQNYLKVPKIDRSIVNLRILLKNRSPLRIYVITGDKMTLVSAMDQQMCGIPVPELSKYNYEDDVMLNVLEKYLQQLIYLKDDNAKNRRDFGLMLKLMRTSSYDIKEVSRSMSRNQIDMKMDS